MTANTENRLCRDNGEGVVVTPLPYPPACSFSVHGPNARAKASGGSP